MARQITGVDNDVIEVFDPATEADWKDQVSKGAIVGISCVCWLGNAQQLDELILALQKVRAGLSTKAA